MDLSIVALLGISEGASLWANIGSVALRVLIVLLGVNMLVIVHEWGHFIVARMCGVRCDKFYIWFDAYGFKIFSFKKGDTEYGLGWLPLGGYVKMLGQEDNPGGIQAEIERAKTERNINGEESDSNKKQQDEHIAELEKQLYAPDSYLAKNVFQRMAIISAGVIMNIIFAIICATVAAFIGTPETSAKIGFVAPGYPAWEAGIQAGDEIVGINGKKNPIFSSILVACMDGKAIDFDVVRSGKNEIETVSITPRLKKGGLTPMIGIGPSPSLELAETKDSRPYELSLNENESQQIEKKLGSLKGGERLTAMNDVPVKSPSDYIYLSRLFIDKPIEYSFMPTYKDGGMRILDEKQEPVKVTLEPTRALNIGIRLTMGEIVDIQKGSVAEKAGLLARKVDENGNIIQQGDVICDIDNEPILDPLTFPYKIFSMSGKSTRASDNHTSLGRSIVLTVKRSGIRQDVAITLPNYSSYTGAANEHNTLACGSLGIVFEVQPIISGVEGTVNFEQNPINATIQEITAMIPVPDKQCTNYQKELFKSLTGLECSNLKSGELVEANTCFDEKNQSETEIASKALTWFSSTLPYLSEGTPVSIKVKSTDGKSILIKSKVARSNDAYLVSRGLLFGVDSVFQRAETLGDALSFGIDKTIESASQVFVFLKNVGKNVSAKALGGPGMIIGTAYEAAGQKNGVFLLFLCLISANLAVVNFLPIPVLDGGHMVFLLYEAITRRKPNEKIQIALSYVGLTLILMLMFWVIFLDILRYCF